MIIAIVVYVRTHHVFHRSGASTSIVVAVPDEVLVVFAVVCFVEVVVKEEEEFLL
jgi:hypothetical protein